MFCSPRLCNLPGWSLKDGNAFLDKVMSKTKNWSLSTPSGNHLVLPEPPCSDVTHELMLYFFMHSLLDGRGTTTIMLRSSVLDNYCFWAPLGAQICSVFIFRSNLCLCGNLCASAINTFHYKRKLLFLKIVVIVSKVILFKELNQLIKWDQSYKNVKMIIQSDFLIKKFRGIGRLNTVKLLHALLGSLNHYFSPNFTTENWMSLKILNMIHLNNTFPSYKRYC